MNLLIAKTFEAFPCVEVMIRKLFAHSSKRIKKFSKKPAVSLSSQKQSVMSFLESHLSPGDVVIVHTRMSALKRFGFTPKELLDVLLRILGPEGSLFMPNMPSYDGIAKLKGFWDKCSDPQEYYVASTKSWTGVIGDTFVSTFGARRSAVPYCSLAGFGPFVDEAFREELDSDSIFDKKSPWFKLQEVDAKILFLGAEAYDSITESHLVEDASGFFPFEDWCMEVPFILEGSIQKRFFIRKPFWNQYLTEFYNIKRLRKKKIIDEEKIGGVDFSCISSYKNLYSFYCEEARAGKSPLFRIPKRYKRKR